MLRKTFKIGTWLRSTFLQQNSVLKMSVSVYFYFQKKISLLSGSWYSNAITHSMLSRRNVKELSLAQTTSGVAWVGTLRPGARNILAPPSTKITEFKAKNRCKSAK